MSILWGQRAIGSMPPIDGSANYDAGDDDGFQRNWPGLDSQDAEETISLSWVFREKFSTPFQALLRDRLIIEQCSLEQLFPCTWSFP